MQHLAAAAPALSQPSSLAASEQGLHRQAQLLRRRRRRWRRTSDSAFAALNISIATSTDRLSVEALILPAVK
jgi:hypothetical protein